MSFDPNAYREESLRNWEEAAAGWVHSQELMREFAERVTRWLLEAVAPQPGQRVLELAAGLGETGMLAAELVAPSGGVVISDQAEAMLDGARARAAELGLANVEFKAINAESMDLPVASADVVLCRWGYMLMADPAAALGETRRVLRSGGRVGLAVWDRFDRNPWALLPAEVLLEREMIEPKPGPPGSFVPGPFALGDEDELRVLLDDAGFAEVRVEALDLRRRHASFAEFWESTLDLSRVVHDAVMAAPPTEIPEIEAAVKARFAPYEAPDGSLDIPARTLVASASA